MIAFLALAAGCFAGTAAAGNCETKRVRLVAGDASDRAELCTALESGGLAMTRPMWRSYLVHELAHCTRPGYGAAFVRKILESGLPE